MGQIRQPQTPAVGATGARCTCCGRSVTGSGVTAALRGVLFDYCGADCRGRHAQAVDLLPAGCELCDDSAVGDTGRCDRHLDGEAEVAGYPLAG
ncbi:MAG TPA: hypothetical protein VFP72_06060 [Kineosporiaceae bacterium]|nr:hypothetical protein [Kineosporiaceae bacterium]